jgi:hypothetical protein
VGQDPGTPQSSALPIPELLMGLLLLVLSRALAVGDEVSLGRTAVLFLACALIAAYGIVRNPYAPFYVYAFIAPTFPAFGTGIGLMTGGTVAVFLNRAQTRWKWQFSWAGLAFCLWTIASLMWAEQIFLKQDSFVAIGLAPMVLAIIISGIRDPLFRRNLVLLVIGACVIGSLVCLRNWSKGRVEFAGGMRVYSLIRPDVFSAWELLGLLGALAWLLAGRPTGWLRRMLIVSVPVMLLGIGLCGYRAAVLSAGLGVIVISMCQGRFLRGTAILGLILVAGGMLYLVQPDMFAPVLSRFQTIQEDRGSERLDIWQGAMKVFSESPVIGVGCDNFKSAVRRYFGAEFMPHSIYIGTLAELGIIGFVLMLTWFGVLLRKTWRAQDRLWVFPLVLAFLMEGAFLHGFYFGCFWLAFGLAEGALPAGGIGASVQPQPARQRLAGPSPSRGSGIRMRRMLPKRLVQVGARLARNSMRRQVGGRRQ